MTCDQIALVPPLSGPLLTTLPRHSPEGQSKSFVSILDACDSPENPKVRPCSGLLGNRAVRNPRHDQQP